MYLWSIAVRINRRQIGYFAAVAKNVLRNIPIFGWAFKLIGFLFLSRSFEVRRGDGQPCGEAPASIRVLSSADTSKLVLHSRLRNR